MVADGATPLEASAAETQQHPTRPCSRTLMIRVGNNRTPPNDNNTPQHSSMQPIVAGAASGRPPRSKSPSLCTICLEPVGPDGSLYCGHPLHSACLLNLLQNGHTTCPSCRMPLIQEESNDGETGTLRAVTFSSVINSNNICLHVSVRYKKARSLTNHCVVGDDAFHDLEEIFDLALEDSPATRLLRRRALISAGAIRRETPPEPLTVFLLRVFWWTLVFITILIGITQVRWARVHHRSDLTPIEMSSTGGELNHYGHSRHGY